MVNSMKTKNTLVAALLLIGIVDQIDGNYATVEYESRGKLVHSTVSLDLSACSPKEGERVAFYKDYKIVTCGIPEANEVFKSSNVVN